eukprot:Awhi_evm1s4277
MEQRKAFANFYEKLWNEDASDEQNYDSEFKVLVEERVVSYTNLSHSSPICHELDDLFSADERNKAAGIDGFTNELMILTVGTEK